MTGQLPGQHISLIERSYEMAYPVQWHRDDDIGHFTLPLTNRPEQLRAQYFAAGQTAVEFEPANQVISGMPVLESRDNPAPGRSLREARAADRVACRLDG